jgi:uncharacterized RDD family membrane protein YckC
MLVESQYGPYRNFWRRFWAGMVDGVIFEPVSWLDKWIWATGAPVPLLVLWFLLATSSRVAYSVLLHGFYGQTVGKRLLGVRVYDVSGAKLSMRQAMLRDCFPIVINLVAGVALLPTVAAGENPLDPARFESGPSTWVLAVAWASGAWLLLELATMLANPHRRALHDFIAGSVVMRVRKQESTDLKEHGGA